MSASLNALDPELQPFARALVEEAGAARLMPRVTSTLRSRAEQERLYARYQRGQSEFPVAPPGTSAHEFGAAFDMVVTPFDALGDVGALWQQWGGVWGAQRDPVHFELPGWRREVEQPLPSPWTHNLAVAADILIGFNPTIGVIELSAWLVTLGYPEAEVFQFLSGPFEYLAGGSRAGKRRGGASGTW